MVTRVPSAAKIDAYSQPAAPLPMTRSDFGCSFNLQDVLRVVYIGVVHRDVRQTTRQRPAGDQHHAGLHHDTIPSSLVDLYLSGRKEAGTALNALDAVAHQVPLDDRGHQPGDLELACHQQAPGVLRAHRAPGDGTLTEAGEIDGPLAQGLCRDAGSSYRDPTRSRAGIDEADALSEVRGLGRPLLARRTGADYDQIVCRRHRRTGFTKAGLRSSQTAAARPAQWDLRTACRACSPKRSRHTPPAPSQS